MKTRHFAIALAISVTTVSAVAQEAPCQDPCLPKAQREVRPAPSPVGAALQEQALLKLKQRFDDADADRSGSLTQAEARNGGFGFVAKHFEAIDQHGKGAVSFSDVRRYLSEQKRK
jgi:hypothetical protein